MSEEITLKELLDRTLSLSQDEWTELSGPTRKKILKLIDPGKMAGVERKTGKKVLMSAKGREVVENFLNLDREEYAEMKPHLREKLMSKITELAQKAGVAG